ncbi:MAG: hypothetical protein ACI4TD_04230 [Phocaeicola sp.]
MDGEIELQNKLEVSGKKAYTIRQVAELLSRMPGTISHYGEMVCEAQTELDTAKHNLKVVQAKYQLIASAEKESLGLSSVDDRKAWVAQADEVKDAEAKIIEASGKLRVAQIKLDRANNEFISVRKLSSIIEKRYEAQKNADKYSNPYEDDEGLEDDV